VLTVTDRVAQLWDRRVVVASLDEAVQLNVNPIMDDEFPEASEEMFGIGDELTDTD
jgi:hypothetical protein